KPQVVGQRPVETALPRAHAAAARVVRVAPREAQVERLDAALASDERNQRFGEDLPDVETSIDDVRARALEAAHAAAISRRDAAIARGRRLLRAPEAVRPAGVDARRDAALLIERVAAIGRADRDGDGAGVAVVRDLAIERDLGEVLIDLLDQRQRTAIGAQVLSALDIRARLG